MPADQMIRHLRSRQQEGMETLLSRYTPLIRYVIAPILSNPSDQEECISDIAMKVWSNIEKFDPNKGSFTTWLTILARNAALTRAKQQRQDTEPLSETTVDPNGDPEALALQKERQAALQKAVRRLSDSDRLLFYRKYYYLQSTAQIAAELGTTERSIEGRLYRIRKKLQRTLKGELL